MSQTSPPNQNPGVLADLFQTRYREVTISAIVFAILIGVVMNAAITYAGLKIGFTIGGSAIAAVLGFGVLRGIMRKGSILETNIAQTVASAVNTSNSGIIFTVPVLFLIGYQLTWHDTSFWLIALAAVAGAMLGTVFIIPLRKQMLDIERLRFPSPTGVAMILKSPGAGPAKAVVLLAGCIIGALIYLPAGLPSIRYEANVDDLEALFERGVITDYRQVEFTRTIADWISRKEAPPHVVAHGELVALKKAKQDEYEQAHHKQDPLADELKIELDSIATQLEEARATSPANDKLAEAAYDAWRGEIEWSRLRHRRHGWATRPLPSYASLEWRMPVEPEPAAEPRDLTGDGKPNTVLTERVDRNQDGRPDLILTHNMIDVGRWLGIRDEYQLVFAIAPFALGAGYITGKAGLFVLAGGILAFFVLNPLAFNLGWMPETTRAFEAPGYGFGAFNRPLGIGMLLGGALMGVLFSMPAIREAIKSIAVASKIRGGGDELGLKTLGVAIVLGLVALFIAADFAGSIAVNRTCPVTAQEVDKSIDTAEHHGYAVGFATEEAAAEWAAWSADQRDAFLDSENARPGLLAKFNPHVRAAVLAIIGAIWIWFAGIIIAQCAGMTDWSPISGMSLLTVVLVLMLAGSGAVLGAVLLGAALCVAITLAADMMGDMKTGYLVGSKPKRQQITELIVVWMGPIIAMLTLMIIVEANRAQFGIAIGPGTDTVAPQAQALQAVITGVQGGEMPYALYGFGALLGGLLGLGAFSGLGVLVGLSMFLPFFYIATYGIGCIINMIVAKAKGRSWAEAWGVPFAAGLIVGESILALVINLTVLAREA
jgi:uncharacterized oligopeptide transporter (OPT) family protein